MLTYNTLLMIKWSGSEVSDYIYSDSCFGNITLMIFRAVFKWKLNNCKNEKEYTCLFRVLLNDWGGHRCPRIGEMVLDYTRVVHPPRIARIC